jgi:lysophospholipase L1-like esterase
MKIILICLPAFLIFGLVVFFNFKFHQETVESTLSKRPTATTPSPSPTPRPKVKYPQDYTLVLLGDSMTAQLGNSDELIANLKTYYPGKSFQVLNYGFGSTNILSVQDRLEKDTFFNRTFMPIVDIDFDLILIESFGHNPLSEYPLEEGLKKQNDALDKIISTIRKSNPKAKIVFYTTISPNKINYAKTSVSISSGKRVEWVNERISYIKNHTIYATSHGIPIINVYEKSLNKNGDGNLIYIRNDDFIHPSPTGVQLISDEIAKFIYNNKILE